MIDRPYQTAAWDAVKKAGVTRGILAMATGTGKTYVAARLPEKLGYRKWLYLAHREELIDQIARQVQAANPSLWVGVEQAERHSSPMCDIVVASVPTLVARDCRRLESIHPERFEAIVDDEHHHGVSETHLKVWRRLGLLDDDNKKINPARIPLYGLTATPGRGDGVGLHTISDGIIFKYPLQQAIADGYLVPIVPWTIETGVSLDSVDVRQGEYVDGQLAEVVDTDDRNGMLLDGYLRHAKGLKTLIFCVRVSHAQHVAEFFKQHGVTADWISGQPYTTTDERKRKLDWFRRTPGAVLSNAQLFSEGVDVPSIECICNAAPTRSKTNYCQKIGRGSRLADGAHDYDESVRLGKREMILLDVTDTTSRIGREAVNIADIWGLPLRTAVLKGKRLEEVAELQTQEIQRRSTRITTTSRFHDLFAAPPEGAIPRSAAMPWIYLSENELRLMLPNNEQVRVVTDSLDRWCIEWLEGGQWSPWSDPSTEKEAAVKQAEASVATKRSDALRLLTWRKSSSKKPPSDKQVAFAKKLGIPGCPGLELLSRARAAGLFVSKEGDDVQIHGAKNKAGEVVAREIVTRKREVLFALDITAIVLSEAIDRRLAGGGAEPTKPMVRYAKSLGIDPTGLSRGDLGKLIGQKKKESSDVADDVAFPVSTDVPF